MRWPPSNCIRNSEDHAWYFSVGVLITGLFLSLGAPFWFNILKQLANLRPAIASKVEKLKSGETAVA